MVRNRGYTNPLETFPATVEEDAFCKNGRTGCWRQVFGTAGVEGTSGSIYNYIRLALQHAAEHRTGPAKVSDPTTLLRFSACGMDITPLYYLVPITHKLDQGGAAFEFQAVFWGMVADAESCETCETFPICLHFEKGAEFGDCPFWPRLEDELAVTKRLLSISKLGL